MGCQNSKLSSDAAAVPPKVRPLLRRRFDEMRRRRKNGMSKKELLNSHSCKTISSPEESVASAKAQPCSMKSQEFSKQESIQEENKTLLNAQESIDSSLGKPVMEEKSDMVIPMAESGKKNEEEPEEHKSKGNEENVEESKEAAVENIEQETSGQDTKQEEEDEEESDKNVMEAVEKKEVAAEKETTKEDKDDEEEEDDDDEETSEDEGSEANICPGSPSFRVYCIGTLPNTQENETLPNTQENDCE